MDPDDRHQRLNALTRLAVGTKAFAKDDKTTMQEALRMFLEDSSAFSTAVTVDAAEHLRVTSEFWPSSKQWHDALVLVHARHEERRQAQRLRLPPPAPVPPEKLAEFMRQIREAIGKKAMK